MLKLDIVKKYKFTVAFFIVVLILSTCVYPDTIKIQFDSTGSFSESTVVYRGKQEENEVYKLRVESVIAKSSDKSYKRYWTVADYSDLRNFESLVVYPSSENEFKIANIDIAVGNIIIDGIQLYPSYENAVAVSSDHGVFLVNHTGSESSELYISGFENRIGRYVIWFRAMYFLVLLCLAAASYYFRNTIEEKMHALINKFIAFIRSLCIKKILLVTLVFAAIGTVGLIAVIIRKPESVLILDLIAILFSLYIVVVYILQKFHSIKYALLGGIACFPGVFIAAERLTSYLTTDEPRALEVIGNFPDGTLRHWLFNESRITYPIMGTISRVVDSVVVFLREKGLLRESIIYRYENICGFEGNFKVVHLLIGLMILLVIVDIALYLVINIRGQKKAVQFLDIVLAVNFLLFVPILELGLKNYNNYDLFSMLFSVLGIEMLYVAIRDNHTKYAWISFALELLSCYEKKTALPVLVVSGVFLVYIEAVKRKEFFKTSIKTCIKALLLGFGISAAIQIYVINILAGNQIQVFSLRNIVTLLGDAPMRFVNFLAKIFGYTIDVAPSFPVYLISFIILIGCFFAGGGILYYFNKSCVAERAVHCITGSCLKTISAVFTIGFILCGFILTDFVRLPYENIGRKVFLLHIIRQLTNALPTFLVIILLFVTVMIRWENRLNAGIYLILPVTYYGIAFAYTLMNESFAARYMNIYILCFALFLIILFIHDVNEIIISKPVSSIIKRTGEAAFLCALMIIGFFEVTASAPVYALFYPVWNTTSEPEEYFVNNTWGEQGLISGEIILKHCRENDIDLNTVNIYYTYNEFWFSNKCKILSHWASWTFGDFSDVGTSENDFYVFDRIYTASSPLEIPPDSIQPLYAVKYRNRVVSRIYRGDQLKEYFRTYQSAETAATAKE